MHRLTLTVSGLLFQEEVDTTKVADAFPYGKVNVLVSQSIDLPPADVKLINLEKDPTNTTGFLNMAISYTGTTCVFFTLQ